MASNDIAAIVTTGGQVSATQEFTSSKALLLRAVNNFTGQKIQSETQARLDAYQNQQAVPVGPSNNTQKIDDPLDMERGYDARMTLETLTRISDWVASIRGRRCLLQRGHRLRHLRLASAGRRSSKTNVIASATR